MEKLNIDCLILIFNELADKNSLHSCILVNKEWCNIVVPILWKEYSYENSGQKLFNTILSCLSSSSKKFLSDNDIKLPSTIFLKAPLFNYVSFYKFPHGLIVKIVKMVFGEEFNPETPKETLLEQEVLIFLHRLTNNL